MTVVKHTCIVITFIYLIKFQSVVNIETQLKHYPKFNYSVFIMYLIVLVNQIIHVDIYFI